MRRGSKNFPRDTSFLATVTDGKWNFARISRFNRRLSTLVYLTHRGSHSSWVSLIVGLTHCGSHSLWVSLIVGLARWVSHWLSGSVGVSLAVWPELGQALIQASGSFFTVQSLKQTVCISALVGAGFAGDAKVEVFVCSTGSAAEHLDDPAAWSKVCAIPAHLLIYGPRDLSLSCCPVRLSPQWLRRWPVVP